MRAWAVRAVLDVEARLWSVEAPLEPRERGAVRSERDGEPSACPVPARARAWIGEVCFDFECCVM